MRPSNIRRPAVSGQFYPDSEKILFNELSTLIDTTTKKESAVGVISPHAGYVYSGKVAGAVLSSIKPRPIYIIMGPNHTGLGGPFSISASDTWKTPLGEVRVNQKLSTAIKEECPFVIEDEAAHLYEHSIEVQLPFLQALQKDFTFVPIVIGHGDLDTYKKLGKSLADIIDKHKMHGEVTIIASSDMTHYESQDRAEEKDKKAIDAILGLNEDRLFEVIEKYDISMCGYAPAIIMLSAAKALGAKSAKLIKYETSGAASGDFSSVVGYAGIIVT
jgi:AmmeMemoRadiSam system protein B